MIKYVITRRSKRKYQSRKRNSLSEADFFYSWSTEDERLLTRDPQNAGSYYHNTLTEAQQAVQEDSEQYQYGHRIWRVELLEEHEQDKVYQADTDKVVV